MTDEILQTEEETKTSWIASVDSLSRDAKKVFIRELLEYRDSKNFKEIKEYCTKTIAEKNKNIKDIAYARTECKAEKSILDSYVVTANVIRELAEKVKNQTFKNYLIDSRVSALDSAIVFKIGDPYGVPFDLPIHSSLDILKTEASAYNSFENFLADCISHYDDKNVVEKIDKKEEEEEEEKDGNPYN
jgi:hypothetical protein